MKVTNAMAIAVLRYPVGLPGWRLWARAGLPVTLRIDVLKDKEAGVLLASSRGLRGLHVEAETLEGLVNEVNSAAQALIELEVRGGPPPETQYRISGADFCAA